MTFKRGIISISFLMLFIGISISVHAQDDVVETKTITRKADLQLSLVGEPITQPVSFNAEYSTETRVYKVTFNAHEPKLELNDPLNYQYFKAKINVHFNEVLQQTANPKTISEQSVQTMFTMLYSMKQEQDGDAPPSGDLHLGRFAMVFDNGKDASEKSMEERDQAIATADDELAVLQVAMNTAEARFRAMINQRKLDLKALLASPPPPLTRLKLIADTLILDQMERDFVNVGYVIPNDIQNMFFFGPANIPGDIDTRARFTPMLNAFTDARARFFAYISETRRNDIYRIHRITLKFERGFVEDIHVEVENDFGKTDWYENIVPIGMSSIANLKAFGSCRLFIRKPKGVDKCIFLSDVLGNYDLWEELLTRDYAPGDTVINNLDPNKHPFITLRKEKTIHLFDSRIYTDLAGLDEHSPNGLVQIELFRRFNFLTHRIQYSGKRGDFGLLNYIYLSGGLTKIENKLKYLPLSNEMIVQNGTIISPNYVTNLDLRRYENAYLALDLNALLHNWKDGKFMFYVDIGARYGRTPIIDSLQRLDNNGQLQYPSLTDDIHFTAHTFTIVMPRLKIEYLSQRRVGFSLSYQFNKTFLLSDNRFKQVVSAQKSDVRSVATEGRARNYHQLELEVRVLTSKADWDHLFFRSRFYFQQGDLGSFFPQVQLGYNYNLVFKR